MIRGAKGMLLAGCLWLGVVSPAGCSSSTKQAEACSDTLCDSGADAVATTDAHVARDSGRDARAHESDSSSGDAAHDAKTQPADAADATSSGDCSLAGQSVASGSSVTAYASTDGPGRERLQLAAAHLH